MKKNLSLIALAITIGMTSCSDDECDHEIGSSSDQVKTIVGSWYEETENEEMRFNENSTFYNRYSNYERCAEVEGRWEYDSKNSKLTYTFPFMGQNQHNDFTVKNLKDLSFILSSTTVADHKLEKIVESYTLDVGQTANILFSKAYPKYSITSYTSNNNRIASVSTDGVIKAEGEKGVTYIKVTTAETNVWVKVTVGDNCADMWFDYVALIGLDYSSMRKLLNRLGEPISGEDGYSFEFIHTIHAVIDRTGVFLSPKNGLVSEVQILMKKAVPETEILTYMNSHYYKIDEYGSYVFYSSAEVKEKSKAIIAYDKEKKCVIFWDGQNIPGILGNYYEGLGMTHDQIVAQFGIPYSDDGNMMLYIIGTEYVDFAAFDMDENTKKCKGAAVTINENVPSSTIIDYLNSKYVVFANGTYEDGSQYAWTNGPSVAESTMGIVYLPLNRIVTYQLLGLSASVKAGIANVVKIDNGFIEKVKTKSDFLF